MWERNAYGSQKDPVTLGEAQVWIGGENLTSVLPSQCNNIVVGELEGEALPEVSSEVRLEEVVPLPEEIPSMVKLDAPQSREVMFLIFAVENVVDGS